MAGIAHGTQRKSDVPIMKWSKFANNCNAIDLCISEFLGSFFLGDDTLALALFPKADYQCPLGTRIKTFGRYYRYCKNTFSAPLRLTETSPVNYFCWPEPLKTQASVLFIILQRLTHSLELCCKMWIPGVQQVQMHPNSKYQKIKFLAIFEGFWPITMLLWVILLRIP